MSRFRAMPEDFVERFADFWNRPAPERLPAVLAPEVRLVQPMLRPTTGMAAAQASFRRLLTAVPDLRADVHSSGSSGHTVLIAFRLAGTFGGRPLEWDAVDRFQVGDDGLATERVSYFDPVPLIAAMARRPRGWPRLRHLLPLGGTA